MAIQQQIRTAAFPPEASTRCRSADVGSGGVTRAVAGARLSIFLAALACLVWTLPAWASCDAGERVIRFSITTSLSGHPKGEAATALARQFDAAMDGRACIQVFPESSLFTDQEVFDALRQGQVELAAPGVTRFGQFSPSFELFNLPFLFDGPLQAMAFFETDEARAMMAEIEAVGLRGLAFWTNGMRQLSATRELRMPEDADGLTFRISSGSPVTGAVLDRLGITPLRLPFRETAAALAEGVVQGQENTWSNIYTQGFYRHQAAVTETNHNYNGYMLISSPSFLASLPEDMRETLVDLIELTTHEYNRYAFEINQLRRRDIRHDGGRILALSADQQAAWRRALRPVWESFADEIGRDAIARVERINRDMREDRY